MKSDDRESRSLRTDEGMMKKILLRRCGDCDTDEYAADQLERESDEHIPYDEEFAEDEGIGEPDYFSTCEYTMIGDDEDDLIDCQGS